MLDALTAMPGGAGCELLLRRNRKARWLKVPTDDTFSKFYKDAIREYIEDSCALDLCLMEYAAMSTGENMGVVYKDEVSLFLDQIPKKNAAKKFDGDKGAFSSLKQRCVRINAPGRNEILAFGPAGVSEIAALKSGSVFALFEDDQIVKGSVLKPYANFVFLI